MKKILLLALTILLIGCSKVDKLYICNYPYYTPDIVIQLFEKEYNAKVIIDEFATNEEMYAKLLASQSINFDIIVPSGNYVPILAQQDFLLELDHSKLDNLRYIDQRVKDLMDYDSNMRYSVPYYYGATAVMVNISKVPEYEESWRIFERADLKNRMTLLDDMREVLGGALMYLGYSLNTTNEIELNKARDLVLLWKDNLLKFDAESFGKAYANGEIWVTHGYPENVYFEIIDNDELLNNTYLFFPKEGFPVYIDNMVILKKSRNSDLAHKFLNFFHRPEIYALFCDEFGFPSSVNVAAREFVTVKPWYSLDQIFYSNVEMQKDVGEYLFLYNNVWFNCIRN